MGFDRVGHCTTVESELSLTEWAIHRSNAGYLMVCELLNDWVSTDCHNSRAPSRDFGQIDRYFV